MFSCADCRGAEQQGSAKDRLRLPFPPVFTAYRLIRHLSCPPFTFPDSADVPLPAGGMGNDNETRYQDPPGRPQRRVGEGETTLPHVFPLKPTGPPYPQLLLVRDVFPLFYGVYAVFRLGARLHGERVCLYGVWVCLRRHGRKRTCRVWCGLFVGEMGAFSTTFGFGAWYGYALWRGVERNG